MKSNDNIPEDELLLAMMLQNAGARGFGFHKNSFYRTASGRSIFDMKEASKDDPVVACCAVGACFLAEDSQVQEPNIHGNLVDGNDSDAEYWDSFDAQNDGQSVGYAFRQAMEGK